MGSPPTLSTLRAASYDLQVITKHAVVRHLQRIEQSIDLEQLQQEMWHHWPQEPYRTDTNLYSDAQILLYLRERGMDISAVYDRIRRSLPGVLTTAATRCLPTFMYVVKCSPNRYIMYKFVNGALTTIMIGDKQEVIDKQHIQQRRILKGYFH